MTQRMTKRKSTVVIFVGPQGAGKTTQAKLLLKYVRQSNKERVILVRLIHYTMLRPIFISIIKLFKKTYIKFYENKLFTEAPSPRLLKAVFPLLLTLHLVSFIVSSILFNLYTFSRDYLIEDEGYVFKQLADILYEAKYCKADLTNFISNFILSIIIRRACALARRCVLVYLRIYDHEILKKRYLLQKRLYIEPADYILFQTAVYNTLVKGHKAIILDASRDQLEIHQAILKALSLLYT